jgi:outer membrane protein TolC
MKRLVIVLTLICLAVTVSFGQSSTPLSLKDCIKIALENNSKLRIAEQRYQSAGTGVTSAYSSMLPRVNSSFSSGRYIQGARVLKTDVPKGIDPSTGRVIYEQQEIYQKSTSRNAHGARVSLSQSILDLESVYGIKQAQTAERSAEHSAKSTRQSVILSVQEAYYELLKAYRLLSVYEEATKQAEEEVSRAQARVDIGISSQAEVFQAKVNLGTQRTNLINQENIIALDKANLNNALALDTNAPIEIVEDKSEPAFPAVSYDDAVKAVLQNNEELKALSLDIKTSWYGVRMAKARYIPTLGGSVSYSRNNDDISRVYSTKLDQDYSASLGAQVDLNIFNGLSDKAGVQRAMINNNIAQESYNDRQRVIVAQVKQVFLQLKAYKDILEINQENIDAAKENLRLQLEKRRVGSGTELEVTQAQTELTRAQSNYVRAEYDTKITKAQLETIMGVVDAGN